MTFQKEGKMVWDTVEAVRSYQNWKAECSCLKTSSFPIATYRYTSGSIFFGQNFPPQY